MNAKRKAKWLLKSVAALSTAGMLFSSNCSSADLEAAFVGLEAAAGHLQHENQDDDISFGDWLLDELNDLDD